MMCYPMIEGYVTVFEFFIAVINKRINELCLLTGIIIKLFFVSFSGFTFENADRASLDPETIVVIEIECVRNIPSHRTERFKEDFIIWTFRQPYKENTKTKSC